jgi:hypothetical protein
LAETLDGKFRPALCYICPDMHPQPPEHAYVHRIVAPAKSYRFPRWYVDRLESFAR